MKIIIISFLIGLAVPISLMAGGDDEVANPENLRHQIDQAFQPHSCSQSSQAVGSSPSQPRPEECFLKDVLSQIKDPSKNSTISAELQSTEGNRMGKLTFRQGDIFQEMCDQILNAKSEILLSTYVWQGESTPAKILMGCLKELQERIRNNRKGYHLPIQLKIVADNLIGMASAFMKFTSTNPNHKKTWISGKYGLGFDFDLDPSLILLEAATFDHGDGGSNHSKYLVVDNHVVLTSGNVQISDMLEMGQTATGPVAQSARADFGELWGKSKWLSTNGASLPLGPNKHKLVYKAPPFIETIQSDKPGNTKILVMTKKADGNLIRRPNDNPQNQALLGIFHLAKKKVNILTPNLNFENSNKILLDCIRRGVDVDLVLSEGFNQTRELRKYLQGGTNDYTMAQLLKGYKELKKWGHSIGRLRLRWYVPEEGQGVNHIKYLSADGLLSYSGGKNMDTQSWYSSREFDFLIPDAGLTQERDAKVFDLVFNRSKVVQGSD